MTSEIKDEIALPGAARPSVPTGFEAADAAYDALPGTPPDGWSFIPLAELGENYGPAIHERVELWRPEGMTFVRVTDLTCDYAQPHMEEGVWIEVWKTQPYKQAPFNPPLIAKATTPASQAPSGDEGLQAGVSQ